MMIKLLLRHRCPKIKASGAGFCVQNLFKKIELNLIAIGLLYKLSLFDTRGWVTITVTLKVTLTKNPEGHLILFSMN